MDREDQQLSIILEEAWQGLSPNWFADIKSTYYQSVFLPMVGCADNIYYRNCSLESYSDSCLSSLGL